MSDAPMTGCSHRTAAGACRLGRYGGTPSAGVCASDACPSRVPAPADADDEGDPAWVAARRDICAACDHRDGPDCGLLLAAGRRATIALGVRRPGVRCPDGRWDAEA